MSALFHRNLEIPLWTLVLFGSALALSAGTVPWLVALAALALFTRMLPATVRSARPFAGRFAAGQRARDAGDRDATLTADRATARDVQRMDDDGGSASGARGLQQLSVEPTSTPAISALPAARRDTHLTNEASPERPGIDAQRPSSMPRAEDDELTRARSPEFHDRPGSGKHTADRHEVF